VGNDKDIALWMDQSEKRLFKRLEVGLEVELWADGMPVKATTANISCGGLFLRINPDEIKQDDHLSLLIHLPNRSQPVKLSAQVLRKEREEREGVAVKFEGLYNDNILAIEQFIKSKLH